MKGRSTAWHAPTSRAALHWAAREAELWEWTLAPAESVEARAGGQTEREMIYVLEGVLSIRCERDTTRIEAGGFVAFENSSVTQFANEGSHPVRYLRVVAP